MLVLDLEEPGNARTFSFSRHALGIGVTYPSITIGRDAELRIATPGAADRHLRLFERDGRLLADVLKPVTIDDRAQTKGHHALRVGSVIYVDRATLRVREFAPIVAVDFDALEADLLALLRDRSLDGHLVYADALEERGFLVRAEYLRVRVRNQRGEPLPGDAEVENRLLNKLLCAPRWLRAIGVLPPQS